MPNFEQDQTYADTSRLSEFEPGVWGPSTQDATVLYNFSLVIKGMAVDRLDAMINMNKTISDVELPKDVSVSATNTSMLYVEGGQ